MNFRCVFVRMTRGSMLWLKEVYSDKLVCVLDIPLIKLIVAILLEENKIGYCVLLEKVDDG